MRIPPNWTWLLPLIGLFLFGCESLPQVEIREVKVPIAVPCIKSADVPVTPKILSNENLNVLDDFDLVIQIASERLDLLKHTGELSALIKACIK